MSDDVRDSLIPYDEIVQDALRAVVGRVLSQIEGSDHLPGEHHFYITFKTQAPGVSIPAHLVAKFPDEMTIVLQNRFWDLKVEEDLFSVGLSFNQTPSTLVIPMPRSPPSSTRRSISACSSRSAKTSWSSPSRMTKPITTAPTLPSRTDRMS